MKQNYFKSMLLMLMMCLGMSAWAEDNLVYTLDTTSKTNKGSDNAYASSEDITVDDVTWNVTGNTTMSPWRIGGKGITSEDRIVYTKTAYPSELSKVSLEIGAATNVTINSIKLIHSTNADFSSSTTINASGSEANTTYEFTPDGGFPANSYYKFIFNITIGSSNKFIEFKNVKFYTLEDENALPSHTAHFSVNGIINNGDDQVVKEGRAINFPTDLADIYGKKFMGWTKTMDYNNSATAPTDLCKEANMGNADVTYYAVFADVEVGEDIPTTFYFEPFTGSAHSTGFTSDNVAAKQDMFYDKSATVWSHYTDTKAPSTTSYATNLDGTGMSNGVKIYKQLNNSTTTILEVKGIDIHNAKNLNVSLYDRRSTNAATLIVEYKIDNAANYTSAAGTIVYSSSNDTWKFTDGLSISGTGSTLDLKISVKVTGTTNRTMVIDDVKVYGDLCNITYSNYCTTVSAPAPTFASLQELIDAELAEETVVNVTIEDIVYGGMGNNGNYMVMLQNSEVTLVAPGAGYGPIQGGTVSGTLENVTWDPYNYVLSSEDGETFWASLEYNAPAGGETETITINPACNDGSLYYTTYSSMNAFYVPTDLYVCEVRANNGVIELEPYTSGDIVPAYTGVLIGAEADGDYEVTIEKDPDMLSIAKSVLGDANALRPTCFDGGITADDMAAEDPGCKFYRLTMHKGETIGFWWGAADGAAFDLAENKAYLAMPPSAGGVKAQGLWFNNGETAIKNVEKKAVNNKTFNLQGQRVNAAQKGIYIVNGRKVVK